MFTIRSVGLDIADHTIEIVALERRVLSRSVHIVSRARMSLEPGIVERGRVVLRKQLLAALEELMGSATPFAGAPRSIIFGLPERQVYTSVLHQEPEKGVSADQQIMGAARESIPLELDDLVYAYRIISESPTLRTVLLYGASKEVMAEWDDFFASGNYHVHAFDHELLAISRGLFGRSVAAPLCVVDIGAERTKIAIFSSAGLAYVHSIERAGDFFTAEMAKELDISKEEAEQIKRAEGMESVTRHVFFQKLLGPILDEITLACDFFAKNGNVPVNDIVLVGGSARLSGLCAYVQEQTQKTCRLGSPFIASPKSEGGPDDLHYIEATGLALKGLNTNYWEKEHPSLRLIRHDE